MANNFCATCGACGCGTVLTHINGKYYCRMHHPVVPKTGQIQDAQILTPEQKARLDAKSITRP